MKSAFEQLAAARHQLAPVIRREFSKSAKTNESLMERFVDKLKPTEESVKRYVDRLPYQLGFFVSTSMIIGSFAGYNAAKRAGKSDLESMHTGILTVNSLLPGALVLGITPLRVFAGIGVIALLPFMVKNVKDLAGYTSEELKQLFEQKTSPTLETNPNKNLTDNPTHTSITNPKATLQVSLEDLIPR